MVNLADCLVELTAPSWSRPQFQGVGCSIEIQLLERTFVVISRSRYQHVGQRVIMSRGSYKWDKKVRNGDGN